MIISLFLNCLSLRSLHKYHKRQQGTIFRTTALWEWPLVHQQANRFITRQGITQGEMIEGGPLTGPPLPLFSIKNAILFEKCTFWLFCFSFLNKIAFFLLKRGEGGQVKGLSSIISLTQDRLKRLKVAFQERKRPHNGNRYYVSFIDAFNRFTWSFPSNLNSMLCPRFSNFKPCLNAY